MSIMMRSVFLLSLVASSALAAPLNMTPPPPPAAPATPLDFGYEGNSGPNFWPDTCQDTAPGQSPIDIREGSADPQTGSLVADLITQENAILSNSGHDIRVALDPNAPKMTFVPEGQSDTFEVQGFHIHSPSEHHVNGKFFDAEMHVVGKSAAGVTSVMAVFFEVSATPQEGNMISMLAENFPLNGSEVPLPAVDFTSVLEATNGLTGFHTYSGSLTTPPCTTGVLWNVMDTPVPVSVTDVLAMRNELVYSARFTQVARDEEPVFTPPKKKDPAAEGDVACDVPVEEQPEAPIEPVEETPFAPAEEFPVEPTAEVPCDDPAAPVEPVEEQPIEELPVEELPVEEQPVEEEPCETPIPEEPVAPVEPAVEEPAVEEPCETPIPEEPVAPVEPVEETPVEEPCETPSPEPPVEEPPVEPSVEEPCETPVPSPTY